MIPFFINEPLVPLARREDSLIAHPHAQRTGGNTIRRDVLGPVYGESKIYNTFNVPNAKQWEELTDKDVEGYRAFTAHFNFSVINLTRPYLPIASLRHPVYRAVSLYHFVRRKTGHRLQELALNTPLEEFYAEAIKIAPRYIRNVQCMRICDVPRADVAVEFIKERYLGVAFTENIGDFIAALGSRLGWPQLEIEKQRPDAEYYDSRITPAFRDMVLADNAEDMALYNAVRAGPPFVAASLPRSPVVVDSMISRLRRGARKLLRQLHLR